MSAIFHSLEHLVSTAVHFNEIHITFIEEFYEVFFLYSEHLYFSHVGKCQNKIVT